MGSGLKLIIAILLGLFAAIIVVTYLQTKEAEYLGQGPQVHLVVASRDIAEGDRISPDMLRTARVPDRVSVKQPGSFEEADEIAAADPMHSSGMREYTLERWHMNEGTLTFQVTFSDQAAKVI